MKKIFLQIILIFSNLTYSQVIPLKGINFIWQPKNLRPCCTIGYDLVIANVPIDFHQIKTPAGIGKHVYCGGVINTEGNGVVYTRKAGFLDLGHVRETIDWTAYLAHEISKNQGKSFEIKSSDGRQDVFFTFNLQNKTLDTESILTLAQRAAYDMATFHELYTYFGISSFPLIDEIHSAFAPEDNYSNLLGTYIARKALTSSDKFEKAVDKELKKTLYELDVMEQFDDVKEEMRKLEGIWWNKKGSIPSYNFLIKRHLEAYPQVTPWINDKERGKALSVPYMVEAGYPIDEIYTLKIKISPEIPTTELEVKDGFITHRDFVTIIKQIKTLEQISPYFR